MGLPDAAYLAKIRQDQRIDANLLGHELSFFTTWGLFSPKEIDAGTDLLLRHLQLDNPGAILDLGCGYGPLGIALAKHYPQARVVMLDKDFVAVDYTRKNIQLNGVKNAEVRLSNGFSAVDAQERFDVILSNIPAKVGKEMMTLFLVDAYQRLNLQGQLIVVTINGLRQYMKREFTEIFGNYDKIKQGSDYTISACKKAEA